MERQQFYVTIIKRVTLHKNSKKNYKHETSNLILPFFQIFSLGKRLNDSSIQDVNNCFQTLVFILKRNQSLAFDFLRISSFGKPQFTSISPLVFPRHESLSKGHQPFPKSPLFWFPNIHIYDCAQTKLHLGVKQQPLSTFNGHKMVKYLENKF